MRVGVLDVGSNSPSCGCDLVAGQAPLPVTAVKRPTRSAEAIDLNGGLGIEVVDRLVASVRQAARTAEAAGIGVESWGSFLVRMRRG